jgi:hypothetical protein
MGFSLGGNLMKAYVATTGALFGLLAVAHFWRLSVEPNLGGEPWFMAFTVVAVALALWSVRLLWVAKHT